MINKKETVKEKSKKFALRIVHLYQYLTDNKKEFVLSKQILRSGTSIGANLAESTCAVTEKDFLSKVYIALKETEETLYWLDLLKESKFIDSKSHSSMFADCQEIAKMLTKTIKTLRSRLQSTADR
ncbi:MAG: four helix bundle protein [Alphaproteobacteria bacterium]|nr:four helix bundle protein [Alphaproteobacteria bacterium]